MSEWNVNYNSAVAERIGDDIKCGKHLSGFVNAEDKLMYLQGVLKNVLSEASWWRDKAEQAAMHYDGMQKQLRENPQDFSSEHAREVCGKSPAALYDMTAKLKAGESRLYEAINSVGEIIKHVQNAQERAQADSVMIYDKIARAIDLMNSYLDVAY